MCRRLVPLFVCAALAPLGGCGAGLITGLASSDRGGATETRPPEVSVARLLPLQPEPGAVRTLVVANAQIAASAPLSVQLVANGVTVDQANPVVSGQGGSTQVTFTLDTAPIRAAVGDPTLQDVAGELVVRVDGRPVAAPVPVQLVRQPVAALVLPSGSSERFVSPIGERVTLQVTGLPPGDVGALQMFVETDDPQPAPAAAGLPRAQLLRPCTDLQVDSAGPTTVLSAVVPGSTFPTAARLFVRNAVAGESTRVANAYYRPDIALALPGEGPTTGGSLVTLIGTALVPLDLDAAPAPAPDFSRIAIEFAKGGRITQLAAEDFRPAESGTDRLVFTMPASPDGRPGSVDIVLRAQLDGVSVPIKASQVFLFANPKPFFGPRGVVLETAPVAVTPVFLDADASAAEAPDFAVLTAQGGVGFLQLLLAQQNGMFQPFAAPRRIGDHQAADERNPRDLCAGDFDADGVPDLFVANAGAASAVHHLVLGRARPAAPLGDVVRIGGAPCVRACRTGRFDADAIVDLLLVPDDDAPPGALPQVLLARPLGPGLPAFAAPVELPVRPLRHDAFAIADLDRDGNQDVVLLRGSTLQLDIAYGNGDGSFAAGQQLDLVLPGYVPDPLSKAVGVHACGDAPLQSLGLVLAGLPAPGGEATPPTLAILPQTAPRSFFAASSVQLLPLEPLGGSLIGELDGEPTLELVLSDAGDPSLVSFGLLRYDASGFQQVPGGVELGADLGAERPREIRALHLGRAFPPTPTSPEVQAVYVLHESDIDGQVERRLSTRLIYVDPQSPFRILLPPDAGTVVPDFDIGGIVGGNFHGASAANRDLQRDLALAHGSGVMLIANDGFGGFPTQSSKLEWNGLLPGSMTLLPDAGPTIDRLVFLGTDSRVAIWRHDEPGTSGGTSGGGADQTPDAVSGELRLASSLPSIQAATLADTTRTAVADVDGDGLLDLVVLLSFAHATQGEGDAAIALLRGRVTTTDAELPFHEPTALTPVHGNAAAIALGDFAVSADGVRVLELAVAVPRGTTAGAPDGDHVRFFRYEAGATPAGDHFVPGAVSTGPQVLFAGSAPTAIAAADFDRDGSVDLLVASRLDTALHLFRNVALPEPGQPGVDVGAFVESLTSPQPLAPGLPTRLQLTDVNGDGRTDAVVAIEFQSQLGQRSTSVGFYLSSGAGEFTGPQFVSADRIGDRDARLAFDIGDWNRDAVPDLFFGWATHAAGDRNVRVLFGGTR
ncbi:MAG: VCBS repeat-containing protein [Planctomycetes bacterium]|nr:VCBS repeat-containing protein [Planctomycetota bacterium]